MYFKTVYKLWLKLPISHRRNFYLCLIISILASFFEMATLASLIPFVTIFLSPENFDVSNLLIGKISSIINLKSEFLGLMMIVLFAILILSSTIIRIFLIRLQTASAMKVGTYLSSNLLEKFISMKYIDFIDVSHSEITSLVYQKTYYVVNKSVYPAISIASNVIVLGIVGVLVLIINPILTTVIVFTICCFYFISNSLIRDKILKYSVILNENYEALMKVLNASIGHFRELKLYGTGKNYVNTYRRVDIALRKAETQIFVLSATPRFALEAILIFVVITSSIVMKYNGFMISDIISSIVFVAVAGQRMLPLAQGIFSNYTFLKANNEVLQSVVGRLDLPVTQDTSRDQTDDFDRALIEFKSIELIGVSFRHKKTSSNTLQNINFTMNSGDFIGITGASGSGKSTFLDILIGFHEPEKGEILFNGCKLRPDNLLQWMDNINLVSQDIYMDSDSIQKIITGTDEKLTENEICKLDLALDISNLRKDISNLKLGVNTAVGERGLKISGGQRQRVAIARAIYRYRPVLILDEATSALDEETQFELLSNLSEMENRPTIILVTHRLHSLRFCDRVYHMMDGELKESGQEVCK